MIEGHALFASVWMLWLVVAVQVLGLSSAWLARVSCRSVAQGSCQLLFLVCMGLVGLSTLVSLFMGPGWFLSSGTILTLMLLGAVWDGRRDTSVA